MSLSALICHVCISMFNMLCGIILLLMLFLLLVPSFRHGHYKHFYHYRASLELRVERVTLEMTDLKWVTCVQYRNMQQSSNLLLLWGIDCIPGSKAGPYLGGGAVAPPDLKRKIFSPLIVLHSSYRCKLWTLHIFHQWKIFIVGKSNWRQVKHRSSLALNL
jgi:hypothetical protein